MPIGFQNVFAIEESILRAIMGFHGNNYLGAHLLVHISLCPTRCSRGLLDSLQFRICLENPEVDDPVWAQTFTYSCAKHLIFFLNEDISFLQTEYKDRIHIQFNYKTFKIQIFPPEIPHTSSCASVISLHAVHVDRKAYIHLSFARTMCQNT